MSRFYSSRLFYKTTFLLAGSLLSSSSLYAADSAIRIKCKNAGPETKIYINNEYKGTCPGVDAFLDAGKIDIRAHKVDGDYEQLFNRQIELIKGVPQRISVVLGKSQLTREATERRAEEERKRKAEEELRLRGVVEMDLKAARNGDLRAMEKMVQYYTKGEGVAKNTKKAAYWQSKVTEIQFQKELKAAKAGDKKSIKLLVQRYETGNGVKQSQKEADFWENELERIEAQKELKQARSGDIMAMNAMVSRYALGKGVEKDAEQSRYWKEQADNKKAEKEKARRKAVAQSKMDKINYAYFTTDLFKDKKVGSFQSTSMLPTAIVMDIISTPFNITEHISLSTDLAAHPSAWAKPDSMVAKAYLQQQSRPKVQDDKLFAAAK